ncbi:MAG: hypothetical protein ACRDTF_21600, partial [Pseudonocardiaceae bacterium]
MVLSRLLRAGEHKPMVRNLKRIAKNINDLEDDIAGLSDAELRAKTDEFRSRHAQFRRDRGVSDTWREEVNREAEETRKRLEKQ